MDVFPSSILSTTRLLLLTYFYLTQALKNITKTLLTQALNYPFLLLAAFALTFALTLALRLCLVSTRHTFPINKTTQMCLKALTDH